MLEKTETAFSVSRHILELTADALVSGDFERFASFTVLPYTLDTETSRRVCETIEDLRSVFVGAHQHLKRKDVAVLHRTCLEAAFQTPDTIIATYETRLISNGQMIEDPFPCLIKIAKLSDGTWRVYESAYPSSEGVTYRSVLAR